ncbi:MAG: hypothetical protein ABS81_25825 [Pseudonocardia sp. SCN 72-86]|nr:MAG: hypothetical protein ABS81_25825 [Pseudonocardia sp. SCN 72-86]
MTEADAARRRPTIDRRKPAAGAEPARCTALGEGQARPRRLAVVRGHLTRNTIDVRIGSAMSSGAQVTITVVVPTVFVATAVRSGPESQGSSSEEANEISRA